MEQKVKLEEMLKQERIKIKTLESQIYQFREELLKWKESFQHKVENAEERHK